MHEWNIEDSERKTILLPQALCFSHTPSPLSFKEVKRYKNQGSKGIRQWLKNWCTMYIPNDDTQNYPFCRLHLVVETLGHSTKLTNQSNFNKNPQGC